MPQSPTVTPQLISSSTGDIILSKEKKKPHLWIIALIVTIVFIISAGITAVYFSNNNQTKQPQSLSINDYRELADAITNYQSNLANYYSLLQSAFDGETNFFMFMVVYNSAENDIVAANISEAINSIPKLQEFTSMISQLNLNSEINETANIVNELLEKYSSIVSASGDKIMLMRKLFRESKDLDTGDIDSIKNLPTETKKKLFDYQKRYAEIVANINRCDNDVKPIECDIDDIFAQFEEETGSDTNTVKEIVQAVINNGDLLYLKNTNENILRLRLLLEGELWRSKSE